MKKLILVFAAAAFMIGPVMSATSIPVDLCTVVPGVGLEQDKEKKEVDINNLPNEITAALNGSEYAGWTAKQAWKMKTDQGWVYKIKMTKGDETKKVKFTKDGKVLKDMDS